MLSPGEIKLNRVLHGKNQDVLKDFPSNFFDSIITDPPYELGFMSKKWDSSGVAYNVTMWKEVLRVAKPGATLFCFGGTRTYHRVACAIEDAGWQLKDSLMWVYGSGFPKSTDISKQLDKLDKTDAKHDFVKWMRTTGIKAQEIDAQLKAKNLISQTSNFAVHFFNFNQPSLPTRAYWEEILKICKTRQITPPEKIEEFIDLRIYGSKQFRNRKVVSTQKSSLGGTVAAGLRDQKYIAIHKEKVVNITESATNVAKQWQGMGTALKPSFEPIILAMKPLEKGLTYAQNARKHGVAGLNIDAGRIGTDKIIIRGGGGRSYDGVHNFYPDKEINEVRTGRFPANVILSHSPDCVQVGTQQINEGAPEGVYTYDGKEYKVEGFVKDCKPKAPSNRGQETIDVYACVPDCPIRIMDTQSGKLQTSFRENDSKSGTQFSAGDVGRQRIDMRGHGHFDSGGASRFFYCAKASRSERESGLKDFVPCSQCGETGTDTHTINSVKNNCIRNNHPTVKPVSIMKYLCKLICMPERKDENGKVQPQVILDPFCGSGSTLLAANEVGLKYIGIDMGFDNVIIASSRSIDTPPDDCLAENEIKISNIRPIDVASNAQQLKSEDFEDLLI